MAAMRLPRIATSARTAGAPSPLSTEPPCDQRVVRVLRRRTSAGGDEEERVPGSWRSD